ncbi:MAG: hypothetical protein BA867_05035 [Desulfobacterales bacterium S5133MH16]|nr:MAG: hypothetical protein BA867_05035 [Desulfobacterales bacterium S5133MH16]
MGSGVCFFRALFVGALRVREEINLHFQESSRPHGKARGGRIAGYLSDEQRRQAGWIGALKCEVIFERALRPHRRVCGVIIKKGGIREAV